MNNWRTSLLDYTASLLHDGGRMCLLADDTGALPLLQAALAVVTDTPVLLLASDAGEVDRCEALVRSLADAFGRDRAVVRVPAMGGTERRYWIPGNDAARCTAMQAALEKRPVAFIASTTGLFTPAFAPDHFDNRRFVIAVSEAEWTPESLARRLIELDYDREFEVTQRGEFAVRGGIFDLFPPVHEQPVRLEFFGNEIDSMRTFDPETQRSTGTAEEVTVVPRGTTASMPEGPTEFTFRDYLPRDIPVLVASPERLCEHERKFGNERTANLLDHLLAAEPALHVFEDTVSHELSDIAEFATVRQVEAYGAAALLPVLAGALSELAAEGARDQVLGQLRHWRSSGYELVACCGTEGEAQRFREVVAGAEDLRALALSVESFAIPAGVALPSARVVLLGERELFGRKTQPTARRMEKHRDRVRRAATEREPSQLEPGCYAVHATRGICRFVGISELETAGQLQEAVELEFGDDMRLFVPLDQVHLLSRYYGGAKSVPRLATLGGKSWGRAIDAARRSVWDLAAEMLRMDALRRKSRGVSLADGGDWERSFAQAFPYRETPDQEQAIREVLEDMADERPMDRLLCGDVGYGKTEVAMRAAFRAVLNGRQVAVLVPTTVLAQQHFRTFSERMADYPVRVEMLSRFRTTAERRAVLQAAAEGTVDILVGTHRLVQADVVFDNLGLLIIDEEQRFGVKHKERLKRLRATVDILTMTATPIPRTLYFSIAGIRRLSTIMTPPADRRPVTTVVGKYDETLIREAVLREIEREGQVFFLHNRVRTIERMAEHLQRLVPEARFAVGHGQMESDELAEIMQRFVAGDVDVLVCTTIIESGVDIPNANTILIDRADRFGLADLYQLRGRVGRYHHQAFAYFLLPPMGALPENARERLAAIRRYTDLGAGFKLALRDLEIRGAGNILGDEQSGHIAAVGFELYCELLNRAVDQLENRGDQTYPEDVEIDLEQVVFALQDKRGRLPASIPPEYVGSEQVRLDCYRELRRMRSVEQINQFAEELRDRFGPVPVPAQTMLAIARIRVRAAARGVHSVSCRNARLAMQTDSGLIHASKGGLPALTTKTPETQLEEIETLVR